MSSQGVSPIPFVDLLDVELGPEFLESRARAQMANLGHSRVDWMSRACGTLVYFQEKVDNNFKTDTPILALWQDLQEEHQVIELFGFFTILCIASVGTCVQGSVIS